MAARKKKAAVKKKATTKKKTAKKKTAKKKVAVKKNVKKAAAKKKTATRKPVKKTAVKKTAAGKKVTAKKPQSTSTATIAQPRGKRSRKSSGTIKPGGHVRINTGRNAGESGRVVRQDSCLGTYLVTLDRCKKDPVYKDIEWGPYFAAQLEVI